MPSTPDRSTRPYPVPAPQSSRVIGEGGRARASMWAQVDRWDADDRTMRRRQDLYDNYGSSGRDESDGDDRPGPDHDDDPDDYGYDDEGDIDDEAELVELRSTATRNALEWAVVLVGAVLVALLLRASLFQAFWIPSESMETTLLIDDRVLVNKISYRLHDINRGDVVVFTRPDNQPGEIRDLIKRVIGLPRDTIEIRDNTVYVNGDRLIEPYLQEGEVMENYGPTVVPDGQIFVMGDNRDSSYDSRKFGTVQEDRVVGRAFVLFWPLNRVGWL